MERGNLAEFRGGRDPRSFQSAYRELRDSLAALDAVSSGYRELSTILRKNSLHPAFEKRFDALLTKHKTWERISPRPGRPTDLPSLLRAQVLDLRLLRAHTARVVREFKAVLPETREGKFVKTMLGRQSPFADDYERLVDMRTSFLGFYTRSCMVSIQAMMDVYPAGLEFISR